ncbi:MAG: hypothetical protein HY402_06555 [Elusimicrobia bacterium]|nr:hypothetical protein [Elusimicrobiota bacterium]
MLKIALIVLYGGIAVSWTAAGSRRLPSYFPPLEAMHFSSETASRDLTLLSFGLRRLGADLAFIQVLQYYGSPEALRDRSPAHPDYGAGSYPELYSRVGRVLRLDPSFHYAVLYGSGALAFNLSRTQEAVRLLEEGLRYEPRQWRYHSYLAALAYQAPEDSEKLIAILERIVYDPECPTMLQNILANLYKKVGRGGRAARLYLYILENTRDPRYREHAEHQLRLLVPEIGGPAGGHDVYTRLHRGG